MQSWRYILVYVGVSFIVLGLAWISFLLISKRFNNKRKFTNYLLNFKLQLIIALFAVFVSILSSAYSFCIAYQAINKYQTSFVVTLGSSNSGYQRVNEIFDRTEHKEIIYHFIGLCLFFTTIIFLVSFYITHKIFGPIHKIRSMIKKILAGEPPQQVTLRTGDFLVDFVEDFNKLISMPKKK